MSQHKGSNDSKVVARPDRDESQRPQTRVPIGGNRDKMTVVNKDKSRVYRWVNDANQGQRVAEFLAAGYRFETDTKLVVGHSKMSDTADVGANISMYVGTDNRGEPLFAYLMSISKEWFDEDQAAKSQSIEELERGMLNLPEGVDYKKKISVSDDSAGLKF